MPTGADLTDLLASVAYVGGGMASVGLPKHTYKIQPGQLYDVWSKPANMGREICEKNLKLKPSKRFILNNPS